METLEWYAGTHLPKELAFSEAEYQARLTNVRAAMECAGLDMLVVHNHANICYLTGFQSPLTDWYCCLLVPREGELTMQTCDLGLALIHTKLTNISPVRWDKMDGAAEQLVELLREQGLKGKRIGIEARIPGLNPGTYDYIRKNFHQCDFKDASDLVLRLRAVKSRAEVDCLRQAGRFTVAGMEAAIAAIKPGISDNALAAAASEAMINAGSEFFSIAPFVAVGHRSSLPHATYKRNFVKRGEIILMEFGGVYQRYTAPLFRTAVIGRPPDQVKRLADAILNTLDLLYENLRPGRTMDEVARAAGEGLKSLGPEVYFRPSHAYSVGIGFPPNWVEPSVWIREGSTETLQPGMTFHTARTLRLFGVMAVGFSETIAVTESGCEMLTHYPRELAII